MDFLPKDYWARNSDPAIDNIFWAVKKALEPFKTGSMYMSIDNYGEGPLLIVRVTRFPNWRFEGKYDPWADRNEQLDYLAHMAYEFFRNRPTLSVDDHIILGWTD